MRITILLCITWLPYLLFSGTDNHYKTYDPFVTMDEICDNGIDDDMDGFTDCADPDLAMDCCCLESQQTNLDPTYIFCEGDSLTLLVEGDFNQPNWSNESGSFSIDGNEITILESGNYVYTAIDSCENLIDDTITVNSISPVEASAFFQICQDFVVVINEIPYDESGEYVQMLTSVQGCDSILNITIDEVPFIVSDLDFITCPGETIEVNNEIYTEPGLYEQVLISDQGCDSTIYITFENFEFIPFDTTFILCEGDTAMLNEAFYNVAGSYLQSLTTVNGCDSLINIFVEITEGPSEKIDIIFCYGDSVSVNGETYFETGIYIQEFETQDLCDSILIINIEEKPEFISDLSFLLCEGDTIEVNDELFYEAGSYIQDLATQDGCDSTVFVDILQLPSIVVDTSFTICEGENVTIGDQVFTETGQYDVAVESTIGCDIIISLSLVVNPSFLVQNFYAINAGDDITINGVTYTEEGIYTDIFETVNGCDSTVITEITVNKNFVTYDLDDCVAWLGSENIIYDEFIAEMTDSLDCAEVQTTILHRVDPSNQGHSCTEGINNSNALCVSSLDECAYDKESEIPLIFEVTISPNENAAVSIQNLSFYQQAPEIYNWTAGPSGVNNYPTLFGLRVLKDGEEIYFEENIATALEWQKEQFDFEDDLFLFNDTCTLRFEMMAYCLIGNGAPVSAWDIDQINLNAYCNTNILEQKTVSGQITNVDGQPLRNVNLSLNTEDRFEDAFTNEFGEFAFEDMYTHFNYDLLPSKTDGCLNGVSTLDLIHIKNHILGLVPFQEASQFVSADANNDANVSAKDLIELRKLILGIYTEFPSNTSWRFHDSKHDFGIANPYHVKDYIRVNRFSEIHDAYNFVAIKIGDINHTALTNYNGEVVEVRSDHTVVLDYVFETVTPNTYIIHFSADEALEILGGQLHLSTIDLEVLNVLPGAFSISSEHVHLKSNEAIISWDAQSITSSNKDEILFSVVVEGSTIETFDNNIILSTDQLQSELYLGESLDVAKLQLRGKDLEHEIPNFSLLDIRPNPFYETTIINIEHAEAGFVKYEIIDVLGQVVSQKSIYQEAGKNTIELSANDFSGIAGSYILKMEHDRIVINEKLLFLK